MGHPGTHVAQPDPGERPTPLRAAQVFAQKGEETDQVSLIGFQSVLSRVVQCTQVGNPPGQRVARAVRDRQGHDSQRRIARSKTPPKKARRSVPWPGLN